MLASFIHPIVCDAQGTSEDERLEDVMSLWEQDFGQLDIPTLTLSYEQFLQDIIDTRDRSDQRDFFSNVRQMLASIDRSQLSPQYQLEFSILSYECNLHLHQLDLIDQLPTYTEVTASGIFHQPMGVEWYRYLVRHWTGTTYSPEEIRQYGTKEAKRIKRAMKKLKVTVDTAGFTNDPEEIEAAFATYEGTLDEALNGYLPDFPNLPIVQIERGTNSALVQVPGYYGNNRLSYNLFEAPFDLHQIPWLYLHEASPGHHFQLNFEQIRDVPRYRERMSYSGFREGWAAYVEELAHELGLYPTNHDKASQMEWDLIRSVRLVLDVGINYEGWTDIQAMSVWREYITEQDDIGRREINRMRRWPAQVLTYKVGAKVMLDARETEMTRQGSQFSLKAFHTKLLSQRSIPVAFIGFLPEVTSLAADE